MASNLKSLSDEARRFYCEKWLVATLSSFDGVYEVMQSLETGNSNLYFQPVELAADGSEKSRGEVTLVAEAANWPEALGLAVLACQRGDKQYGVRPNRGRVPEVYATPAKATKGEPKADPAKLAKAKQIAAKAKAKAAAGKNGK